MGGERKSWRSKSWRQEGERRKKHTAVSSTAQNLAVDVMIPCIGSTEAMSLMASAPRGRDRE
jgi:hypothetical protein